MAVSVNPAEPNYLFYRYIISIDIIDNRMIQSNITILLQNQGNDLDNIGFTLPITATDIKISDIYGELPFNIFEDKNMKRITIFFRKSIRKGMTKKIEISFKTIAFIRSVNNTYLFTKRFKLPAKTKYLKIILTLPEGYGLPSPKSSLFQDYPAIVPEAQITSDGRRLRFIWVSHNILKNKDFNIFLQYEKLNIAVDHVIKRTIKPIKIERTIKIPEKHNLLVFILISIFGAVLGAVISSFYFRLRRRHLYDINTLYRLSSLTEDEEKILKIILRNKGEIHQSSLTNELDFSKSKVTRLLKSMKNKNIITIERSGKINIIRLDNSLMQ